MTLKTTIRGLGPYSSLAIFGIPFVFVEGMKLLAVVVFGHGDWIYGVAFLCVGYGFGLLLTKYLFVLVKPQLMTFGWFKRMFHFCEKRLNFLTAFATRR